MPDSPQFRRGPLRLWPELHPCPICELDRDALGHYLGVNGAQLTMDDLVAHLGACEPSDDAIGFHDEVEPF